MKALVYQNGSFKWVKVDLSRSTLNGDIFTDTEGNSYSGTSVYKFMNDIRKGTKEYVYCGNCRCIVPRDKWEEHVGKMKAKADCVSCKNMVIRNQVTEKMCAIKKNEDGTYTASQKIKFRPFCNNTYEYCETSLLNNHCKYYSCERCKGNLLISLLSKYPKAYEGKIITSRVLLENNWQTTPGSPRVFTKNNINAVVDDYGILSHFSYETRSATLKFRYSSHYNEFFRLRSGSFDTYPLSFQAYTTENISEKIVNTIKNLYK